MTLKIAVLDDYQEVSKEYFSTIGDEFEVHYFKDTLLPYSHPETPQNVKDQLAQRLEPFHIISKSTFMLPQSNWKRPEEVWSLESSPRLTS